MPAHAIVVGIDSYENQAWNLASAVRDATRFLDWALDAGGVDPARATLLLAPAPAQARVAAQLASYQAIQDAIDRYALGPALPDDRLYVFFACHGISAPGVGLGGGPVLIPADVSDLVRHRKKLYALDEMIDALASHGPREQFFFIDACRDFALDQTLQAPTAIGAWRPKDGSAPCRQYALYATSAGGRAFGEFGVGVFSDTLLAALSARGPRLSFDDTDGQSYQVVWAEAADYVSAEVAARISRAQQAGRVQEPQAYARVGSGRAVLRTLSPEAIERRTLSVAVQPPGARKSCRVTVSQQFPEAQIEKFQQEAGPGASLPLPIEVGGLLPGTYVVAVRGAPFLPDSRRVALWTPKAHLDFTMKQAPGAPDEPKARAGTGRLALDTGERWGLDIVVRDLADTIVGRGRNQLELDELTAGTYKVRVHPVGGAPIEEPVEVIAKQTARWKYRPAPLSVAPAVTGMLGAHGLSRGDDDYDHPSELLGAMPDQTLASLLGLAAAAQVFRAGGDLRRLRGLGVVIPPVAPSPALIVLVASADGPLGELRVGLMEPAGLRPLPVGPLAGFSAGAQAAGAVPHGVHDVRIELAGGAISHHAVAALPEHISILVVVVGREPEVQQYILPGTPGERDGAPSPQLARFIAAERLQRRFATAQYAVFSDEELDTLLHGKWIDPLFGAIGGYALLRRDEPVDWGIARHNMLTSFGGLPDSHVLAALASASSPERDRHFGAALAAGVPVVAEGARALAGWARRQGAPLPPRLGEAHRALVPGTPWTSWVSPRPRVALTDSGLGAIPPGWDDLADREAEIAAAVPRLAIQTIAPATPGTRVAVIAPAERLLAPGVVLSVGAAELTHDCAPLGDGYVIAIDSCAVVGIYDAANPTRARR